jgi:putative hydrolase
MSLLEGHADVIMDAVGPKVVKTVEQLRPRFDARRLARGRLERALRRLAGLEAKTAQYVQGATFVRSVLATAGHEGLNRAFRAPDMLPSASEMEDPGTWIARAL